MKDRDNKSGRSEKLTEIDFHQTRESVGVEFESNLRGLTGVIRYLLEKFPKSDSTPIHENVQMLSDAILRGRVLLDFSFENEYRNLEHAYEGKAWGVQINLNADSKSHYAKVFFSDQFGLSQEGARKDTHLLGAVVGAAYTISQIENLRHKFPDVQVDNKQLLILNYYFYMPEALREQEAFESIPEENS
jgi:hypothetical protein